MSGHTLEGLGARMEIFEQILHETQSQVSSVALSVARLEQKAEAEVKQIEKLSEKIDSLAKCDDVEALRVKVESLEAAPGKRWRWAGATAGAVVITSIISWILSRLLPPGGLP